MTGDGLLAQMKKGISRTASCLRSSCICCKARAAFLAEIRRLTSSVATQDAGPAEEAARASAAAAPALEDDAEAGILADDCVLVLLALALLALAAGVAAAAAAEEACSLAL